jgi:hypothetical protein
VPSGGEGQGNHKCGHPTESDGIEQTNLKQHRRT